MRDLSRREIEDVFALALEMEALVARTGGTELLRGKLLATLFYQPSTRTRLSFEAAMLRLGGGVIGFATPETSRAGPSWGEGLADTARVISGYADVVAIRHPVAGAAGEYAKHSAIPVINGGDGIGPGAEHPTQALVDLYTIARTYGRIDGLSLLFLGGPHQRASRSLALLFGRFI